MSDPVVRCKHGKALIHEHCTQCQQEHEALTDPAFLHMTSTSQMSTGSYVVYCRCRWAEAPFDSRNQARTAGDAHLAKAAEAHIKKEQS